MKLKYLLKSFYLLIISNAYYVMTDKGASMQLPEDRRILEGVQDEMEMFDIQLEEMITNLILEERSEAQD